MPSRRPPLILLDSTECEYKLARGNKISFCFKHGTAVVFKVNINDPQFIIRYKLGERDFNTGLTNVKLLVGDLVQYGGKLFQVNRVQRSSELRLVFAEAALYDIPEQRDAA